jgi:hypothetical protein
LHTYCIHASTRRSYEKARSTNAELPYAHSHLASAYALKGETEHAAAELAEARKLSGDYRYSSFARLKTVQYWGVPKIRALYEATYFRRPAQGGNAGGVSAMHGVAGWALF